MGIISPRYETFFPSQWEKVPIEVEKTYHCNRKLLCMKYLVFRACFPILFRSRVWEDSLQIKKFRTCTQQRNDL